MKKRWLVSGLIALSIFVNAESTQAAGADSKGELGSASMKPFALGGGGAAPKAPTTADAAYIMDKPHLVHIFEDFYLISLPFRLETDETYERVECRAILRYDEPEKANVLKIWSEKYADRIAHTPKSKPEIVAVYPTRRTLKVSYDRTISLEETFSPEWAGAKAGEIKATQATETTWDRQFEHALGSFDNHIGEVQWEYLPAKNQHVPTGIMTSYAVVRIPKGQETSVWVSPYEYTKEGWFAKDGVAAQPTTAAYSASLTLKQFAQLHNSEFDEPTVRFIADLQGIKTDVENSKVAAAKGQDELVLTIKNRGSAQIVTNH